MFYTKFGTQTHGACTLKQLNTMCETHLRPMSYSEWYNSFTGHNNTTVFEKAR